MTLQIFAVQAFHVVMLYASNGLTIRDPNQ